MCVSASLGQRYPMVSQSTTGSITMKFTQSYSPLRYRWRPGPLWDRLWRHGVAGVLTASEIACVGWWWRSHGASFRIPKQTSLETTFLTFASWRAGSHVNDIANIFTLSSVILLISSHPIHPWRQDTNPRSLTWVVGVAWWTCCCFPTCLDVCHSNSWLVLK